MKRVKIAERKARLRQHLRAVRRGRTIVVLDHDTPVARLAPYGSDAEALTIRRMKRRGGSLRAVPIPHPLELHTDIVQLLLEDRQGAR